MTTETLTILSPQRAQFGTGLTHPLYHNDVLIGEIRQNENGAFLLIGSLLRSVTAQAPKSVMFTFDEIEAIMGYMKKLEGAK